MLMLAQVNAFRSSLCQTLMKHSAVHQKQVKYDDSLVRRRILEVSLQLNFIYLWLFRAQQQQEVNNFGSSDRLPLQTYNADYWPGVHTTALSVVRVNADIF